MKIFKPRLLTIPTRPQKIDRVPTNPLIDHELKQSRLQLEETRKKYNTTKQNLLETKQKQEKYEVPEIENNILSYYDNPFKYMDYLIEKYCK